MNNKNIVIEASAVCASAAIYFLMNEVLGDYYLFDWHWSLAEISLIIPWIIFFISLYSLINIETGKKAFYYASCKFFSIWFIFLSPFNNYNFFWIIAGLIIYFIFASFKLCLKLVRKKRKLFSRKKIIFSEAVFVSILGNISMHILFAGYRILSIFPLYFLKD